MKSIWAARAAADSSDSLEIPRFYPSMAEKSASAGRPYPAGRLASELHPPVFMELPRIRPERTLREICRVTLRLCPFRRNTRPIGAAAAAARLKKR